MEAAGGSRVGTPPLWRNRDFGLLFAAQLISLTGSGVTTVGLALFAYELVGDVSATVVIGNALTLRILAFLLFSQPAGVIADWVSRKKILIAADVARLVLLGLFPWVSAVWQIYALIFAINAITAFFTPTFEASIPEVVGGERYIQALGLSRVATDAEAILAPALAGLLVAWVGVRWVFWFDAFTYLASASLVVAARVPSVPKPGKPLSWRVFFSEIATGTRILLGEPSLRRALVLSFAEATAGAAAIVATVVYVQSELGAGEIAFSLTMAVLGLGSTLTALLLGRLARRYERDAKGPAELHRRRHRWASRSLLLGGALLGLALVPGFLHPPLSVFGLLWMLNGMGQALIAIPSSTLLAEHTAEGERGRAYAAHFALTHACWLITYPAVGHAAAAWGAPSTFTAAGAVCLFVTVMAFAMGGTDGHEAPDVSAE